MRNFTDKNNILLNFHWNKKMHIFKRKYFTTYKYTFSLKNFSFRWLFLEFSARIYFFENKIENSTFLFGPHNKIFPFFGLMEIKSKMSKIYYFKPQTAFKIRFWLSISSLWEHFFKELFLTIIKSKIFNGFKILRLYLKYDFDYL